MKRSSYSIGACGLICEGCEILEASSNPELARSNADWLHQHGYPQVRPEDVHCSGCKGDRAKHWSADCRILECCVDRKGLEFCYQCQTFPCDRLSEWAKESRRYGQALSRLQKMRKNEEDTP